MALRKVRTFEYRPPRRRIHQLREEGRPEGRPRIELPRAGNVRSSGTLRLVIFLVALIAIVFVMMSLR